MIKYLNDAQKSIYSLQQAHPHNCAFNLCAFYPLDNDIDIDSIQKILNKLLYENPLLRFYTEDGVTFNEIEYKYVYFETIESMQPINILCENLVTVPFDLCKGPLYNFKIVLNNNKPIYVILLFHHIILDGYSMSLIGKYIYNCLAHENYSFQPSSILHHNKKDEEFWTHLIPTIPDTPYIKTPMINSYKAKRLSKEFNSYIIDSATRLSTKTKAHISSIFLASIGLSIYYLTSNNNLCIGCLTHGRWIENRNSLGVYINKLPVILDYNTDISSLNYIKGVNSKWKLSLRHSKYSYEQLQNEVNKLRGTFIPITDIVFSYHPASFELTPLKLSAKTSWIFSGEQLNSLSFHVIERSNEDHTTNYDLLIDYNTEMYDSYEIEELYATIVQVIKEIDCNNPDTLLHDLDYLGKVRYDNLVNISRGQPIPLNKPLNFIEWFNSIVKLYPDKIALIYKDRQYSYRELENLSSIVASNLKNLEIVKGHIIPILFTRGEEAIISILAILKLGATFLPLDEKTPIISLSAILEEVKAQYLITNTNVTLENWQGRALYYETLIHNCMDYDSTLCTDLTGDDLAYIIYTSGSTGKAKGVMISHKQWCSMAHSWGKVYSLNNDDVVLQVAPFSFDVFVSDIAKAFLYGGTLAVASSDHKLSPKLLYNYALKCRVTIIDTLPDIIYAVAKIAFRSNSFGSIRLLILGAKPPIKSEFEELSTKLKDKILIYNSYGVTEACVDSCIYLGKNIKEGPIPIGKPLPNVNCYVFGKYGLIPKGYAGMLYIGGVGVSLGYIHDSNSKFIAHKDFGYLYNTGDMVKWNNEEELVWLGRYDNEVKISGVRVNLNLIEEAILSLPYIEEAVVTINDLNTKSELIGYYVSTQDIHPIQLREDLKSILPYYMIPRHIIKVADIPRGANEKADIALLRKIYTIQAQTNSISLENAGVAATIIKELENLGLDNISLNEDIFSQGLDSLMLFSLISNLEDSGIVINPEDLFTYPTINKLSSYIASLKDTKAIVATDFAPNRNLKLHDNIIEDTPRDISIILLTGATGFLGINLLHSLLHSTDSTIYCILRDTSIDEGFNRLEKIYRCHHNESLKCYRYRIHIVLGDLSVPDLNISKNYQEKLLNIISCVIHCGAYTKYYGDPSLINRINVDSNRSLARLCSIHNIPIYYISTLSTGLNLKEGINQYVHSKRAAEDIISGASPHNMIIRLGNLIPREKSKFIGNPLDNAMYQRIKYICSIGFVPKELLNLCIDWTFVDYAAASVVNAIRTESKNALIEIVQYGGLTLEKLMNILNDISYNISEMPMKLWLNNFSSGIGALMNYELQKYLIEGNIQYSHELKKNYMFTEPLNLQEIKEALKKLL
ncbi:AMP-binding protein [Desnuesiella massiliensis]|uniref:AMP-binding protein n=1 Tax=Desnuesiella massiliensis TaxID=1650662 RepID=UPI0006E2D909|nr:AMP-binding protein [Desnuesiella massiliensis]